MSYDRARRMKQYLFLRLLIVVVGFLLATFYIAYLQPETKEVTTSYLLSILAVYGAVGVASLVTFERWVKNREVRRIQVLVDFGLQALLIWSTGGIVSFFIPLLFVTFVSATALGGARRAFLLASLATCFLVGNVALYSLGMTPPWGVNDGQLDSLTNAYLVMSVLALYGLTLLGSRYSSGLRTVEHLQAEVIENMGEGLIVVDRDARVMLVNEEFRSLLDLEQSAEALCGRPLIELLRCCRTLEHDRELCKLLVDALSAGHRTRFEIAPPDRYGRPQPLEVKVSAISGEKGEACYRIAMFSDQSLQKELELQKRRVHKLEDLRELAMGLAHEIRNPLASIRGCVQEIGRLTAGCAEQDRFVEIVLRESDRLDGIVENFQRFARATPASLDPVDLRPVISETIALLENHPELGDRHIEFDVPAFDAVVLADRGQLSQVLLNLGLNAIQATSSDGGRFGFVLRRASSELGLAVDPKDGNSPSETFEIQVWDNGNGIRQADQERVLDPFFTTKEGGSGLGLSIVDKIIREHGGSIEIESSESEGTCVSVRIGGVGGGCSRSQAALAAPARATSEV